MRNSKCTTWNVGWSHSHVRHLRCWFRVSLDQSTWIFTHNGFIFRTYCETCCKLFLQQNRGSGCVPKKHYRIDVNKLSSAKIQICSSKISPFAVGYGTRCRSRGKPISGRPGRAFSAVLFRKVDEMMPSLLWKKLINPLKNARAFRHFDTLKIEVSRKCSKFVNINFSLFIRVLSSTSMIYVRGVFPLLTSGESGCAGLSSACNFAGLKWLQFLSLLSEICQAGSIMHGTCHHP